MKTGTLYWITGLSGAGKTTIGNRLYYELKKSKPNTIILDGDILKRIAGKDLGYEKEARLERAHRYCELCKILTDQGVNVVICTIAMFDIVREWNRNNIDRYVEVFLDVDIDELRERNRKGLYSKTSGNVAGVDVAIEFPKHPDIVVKNTKGNSIGDTVRKILSYEVVPLKKNNRDEDYWNSYYLKKVVSKDPSLFAQAVMDKYFEQGKKVLEFGCGNGRDSLYFAKNGMTVTGIDSSEKAIQEIHDNNEIPDNCSFVCDDFVSAEAIYQIQYDYCYSRFTLHAINEKQESIVIKKAYEMLKDGGLFLVEARSIHDGKFGQGNEVEKNAFILDGHYRRFIDVTELEYKVKKEGFEVMESEESDQFAPHKGEKSVCLRMVCKKKE